ncbi:tudor domain-containing 6 isoform X3 [Clupea harengus]|uniref:Tudor domain-containing 6 isoform X3 n=1 Tax=Clupea harengus TaxID=7950 RepID=A0A6P8GD32_CLUHA|nr:tudor domain-containing 6 isoform X3 [Clupea harengus]
MNLTQEDSTMWSLEGLPSPGSNVTVLMTRVNSNPLCVMVEFWGNFSKERRLLYEQMRKEIQCCGERFQEAEGSPGDLCLVQICEKWYRARVVSCLSSNYSVFLFDEGKTLNVKTNTLAWGKREHFLLPPEVELCVLANVLPLSPDNKWSPMALEYLRSLCGKVVTACVQEVFVSQRAFLLDIPCLSRQILEMGFAKKLEPERFREFVVHTLQPSGSGSTTKLSVNQSMSDKSTDVRHLETQLNYMYPELQPEMVETVVVTEVTNPSRIFCQLKVFSQELMKLTEQITKHYEGRVGMCPPPQTLGSPCAARGPDGKWYRAVLQQVMTSSNVAEVLQVDYGKKHFTQIDSIRHLAAEFFRMPVVTYVCSLHGVIDKGVGWTASQIEYLKSLLLKKTLIAKFEYQSLSEGVHYVTLIGAGSRNLNKDFGTHAECLIESEKILEDFSINKNTTQRLCPPSLGEEMKSKSNMPKESLPVNTTHKAVVQYVESPSEFWVQTQKYADEFDQMMNDLTELYYDPASAEGLIRNPTIGLFCAASSKDGSYYRGNVREIDGKQLLVYFVDYGNTEIVDSLSLRHLPSKYQRLPPLALKCALVGIKPVCDGWSVKALNFFSNFVMDKVLDLHVAGKMDDKHVVQLSDPAVDGEKDLCHLMCSAGLARKGEAITKPVFRPQTLLQDPQVKIIETKSEALSGSGAAVPKASRSAFKEYLFSIGSSVEVNVSHIDSPNDFWCQIARNIGYLKLLMQDIQCHYADSEYEELTEAACVARHPENGMWYRALVIYKHQTPHVDVLFIDYGQTRKVPLQELRPIGPSFLKLNGQAFRCSLYNLIHPLSHNSHEWDSNATHLFQEFVDCAAPMNITLKCTIYAVMYDMQKVVFNVVDLETPFQSVCSLLVQNGLALSAPPKKAPVPPFRLDTYYYSTHNLKMGSEEELIVTTVKSVNQFYCQLGRNSEVIKELADKVHFLCHQLEAVQCPKTFGTVCFAKYTDGEWYRGQIKSTSPSIVVSFVDYGDTLEVEKSDLLPIPIEAGEIMSVPVQAIECGLSDISADVPRDVNTWFERYVIDHFLKAVIVAKEPNGKLLVELYDGKSQVNSMLKEKFAAEMQKIRRDAALEHDTRISQNFVGGDMARFESNAQANDYRQRRQGPFYRDGDVRKVFKPDSNSQVHEVWQKQHSPTHIPFNRGDAGRNSTKFESKAPVSNTEISFDRGDGQNLGNLYSRPKADVPRKQDDPTPSSLGSGHGGKQITMEPGRASFSDVSVSAEFRVRSSKPAKDGIPEACPTRPIEASIVSSCEQVIPKLSDLPPKSIMPKMDLEVFVSHCNSPSSFFVQLVLDEDDIFSMVEKLNNGKDPTPLCVKDIREGDLVNAEFPEDQSWYRAVIKTQIGSDSFDVEFIDFGNTATVSSSKICRLAQSHLGHPRLSIHCFLSEPMTVGSERYSDDFSNEIDGIDGVINCTFIQEKETRWEVILVANGKRLGYGIHTRDSTATSDLPTGKDLSPNQDNSLSEGATQALEEVVVLYKKAVLSEGQTLDVFASSISGPEYFWCQYSKADMLQEISDLAQHVGNAPELKSVNTGSLHVGNACLALFADDELWYRAEILSKEGDSLSVLFVDYGNESHVDVGKVRAVPLQLQDIPPQAFLCQLDGFDLSPGSWKEGAADQFFELLNDKLLKVTVEKPTQLEDGRTSYIVRVEFEDQIISDMMKGCWCSSSGSGESPETTEESALTEPAAPFQSILCASDLESVEPSDHEKLTCDMEHLPQEVFDCPVAELQAQSNLQEFSETLDDEYAIPVLPIAENLDVHLEEEAHEKDPVTAASSWIFQKESVMPVTESAEQLLKDVVQKLISDALVISSAQAFDKNDLDEFASSTVFILEEDLSESTPVLCIDESYEMSSTSHDLGVNGDEDSQACEDVLAKSAETTGANPETGEDALEEESANEVIESNFGKLRRAAGNANVGGECIVWSQANQNWCRAKVLSIYKETFLVLLLEEDSQMAVDPQSIFEAIPEEQTESSPVDTDAALSDDLTQDTQVETDLSVDPPESVSDDEVQPEEFQSDDNASSDDHGPVEEPSSIKVKLESYEVQADSVPSPQLEEDLPCECQADVDALVDVSGTAELDEDPNDIPDAVEPLAAEEQIEECLITLDAPGEVVPPAVEKAPLEEPESTAEQNQEQHQETALHADLPREEEEVPLREIQTESCSSAEDSGSTEQNTEPQERVVELLEVLHFSPDEKIKAESDGDHDDEQGDADQVEKSNDIPAELDLIDLTSDTEDSDTASDDTVKDVSENTERIKAISQSMEDLLSGVTHLSLRTETASDDSDDDVIFVCAMKKTPLPEE